MHTYQYEDLTPNRRPPLENFNLERKPEKCPLCNSIQDPSFVAAFKLSHSKIEAIFRCNKALCNSLFISILSKSRPISDMYTVNFSYPTRPKRVDFDVDIENISPLFVEIYNQANKAESSYLHHVAGMGYRKSLEFLIKDYLIKHKGEDEETIEKEFLGKCINQYLSDNIKKVAQRATWLGNDETHYHRVWEDRDIQDLKRLINLTVYWISSEIKTEKYITEMDSRK
ncbi:hypothetical protein [Bacillus paralicheniformis]|uniref:hypothetical protein n=1 Tax=Bacillus paralicheniformis TaxID=1648923 RepID=UPI001D04C58E|nr:hypothetical protein [Bacillus paralicheniformis]